MIFLMLLFVIIQPPASKQVVWDWFVLGQLRATYEHRNAEFEGCLYGIDRPDSVIFLFFIPSNADPRKATSTTTAAGDCIRLELVSQGYRIYLLARVHSHIKTESLCLPSSRDQMVFNGNELPYNVILCDRGRAVFFQDRKNWQKVYALPPLDSLYKKR